MFQEQTSILQSRRGTFEDVELPLAPRGLNWKENPFPSICSSSWSSDEEDDDDNSANTVPLIQSGEYLSVWAQSVAVLIFSRHTAFADRVTERAFLDGLLRRTAPLAYVRLEHSFPLRWHTPEDLFLCLAHVNVGRLVMSNLHFSKSLPLPWMITARCLELRDCWFDGDFTIPPQCNVISVRISGGFGVDPDSKAFSYLLNVVKQHAVTDFGYIVEHWDDSVSQALLEWIQCNSQLRTLELGTDLVACLTRSQWIQWMTVLAKCPLSTLTLHVRQRYDEERAVLLRDMLQKNRHKEHVRFIGLSQDIWTQSVVSVCDWNRFANGVTKVFAEPHKEALLHVTMQRSRMDFRRLAFVLSEHTDMLCHWVSHLSNARKRKRPRSNAVSVGVAHGT